MTSAISISRSAALTRHFGAPLRLYGNLYDGISAGSAAFQALDGGLCVGKEWYRFPSSFFLPSSHKQPKATIPLLWLNSSFNGQLPRPYGKWPQGLSDVPPDMNDRNLREDS